MIFPLEVEGIEAERLEAGLPVVETPGRVDRDKHVVIEASRVRVVGGPVGEAPWRLGREYLPRPRPEEPFSREPSRTPARPLASARSKRPGFPRRRSVEPDRARSPFLPGIQSLTAVQAAASGASPCRVRARSL